MKLLHILHLNGRCCVVFADFPRNRLLRVDFRQAVWHRRHRAGELKVAVMLILVAVGRHVAHKLAHSHTHAVQSAGLNKPHDEKSKKSSPPREYIKKHKKTSVTGVSSQIASSGYFYRHWTPRKILLTNRNRREARIAAAENQSRAAMGKRKSAHHRNRNPEPNGTPQSSSESSTRREHGSKTEGSSEGRSEERGGERETERELQRKQRTQQTREMGEEPWQPRSL